MTNFFKRKRLIVSQETTCKFSEQLFTLTETIKNIETDGHPKCLKTLTTDHRSTYIDFTSKVWYPLVRSKRILSNLEEIHSNLIKNNQDSLTVKEVEALISITHFTEYYLPDDPWSGFNWQKYAEKKTNVPQYIKACEILNKKAGTPYKQLVGHTLEALGITILISLCTASFCLTLSLNTPVILLASAIGAMSIAYGYFLSKKTPYTALVQDVKTILKSAACDETRFGLIDQEAPWASVNNFIRSMH